MQKIRTVIATLLFTIFSTSGIPCSEPKRGDGRDKDELIAKAEMIVLAEVVEIDPDVPYATLFYLKPTRTLKGKPPERIEFMSVSPEYSSSDDFDGHTKEEFWTQDIGRSKWPCCICGPDHVFEPGETYLLFPDSFGAMKSAELIRSEDDKWLKYVETRIKEEHIQSSHTTPASAPR
ncbi:hypothetical protein QEH56_24280 [Pelagicoccus enzymogenes]|uniref:hypothetical protein n=1 Tax=Pelagicoccus enzymogenes TaxID=2773457 RepID=UPI00280DEA8B|nr:hypothetical protein [Pelagicoccus enzymogenes]MDQ8201300.1 hypothetical protein [Pelagicoccus enzymogenes]